MSSIKYVSIVTDSEIRKMYDLEVGEEYQINRITETRFGHVCSTDDGVRFYTNRSLSNYIETNNIKKFYLRINAMKDCIIDGKNFKYPLYDVAIIRRVPDVFIAEDYENIIS